MREIKKDLVEISKFVDYVLIRNYEFLFDPKEEAHHDIDILVKGLKSSDNKELLKMGYFLIHNSKYRTKYAKYLPKKDRIMFLDFHKKNLTGNPVSYIFEDELLRSKRSKQGIQIPSVETHLSALLMRELVSEGFKDKYRKRLQMLLKYSNKQKVASLLSKNLSRKDVRKVILFLIKGDFDSLDNIQPKIKCKFVLRNLSSYFLTLLTLRKIRSRTIAIIGMDGSGKSTIVKKCEKTLLDSGVNVKRVYMGRGKGNIIPIKRPAGFVKTRIEKFPKSLKSILYSGGSFLYTMDFIMRHLTTKRDSRIVLSDRYSSDILLMQNVPRWLRRALYLPLPKAREYVYLFNDLSELRKRKGHRLNDLKRQQKEFQWANKILKPHKIKNQDMNKTMDSTLRIILSS